MLWRISPRMRLKFVFLLAILLATSGCSSTSEDKKANCEKIQNLVSSQGDELNSLVEAALGLDVSQLSTLAAVAEKADQLRRSRFQNIILGKNCFTQYEVNEAKLWLAENP